MDEIDGRPAMRPTDIIYEAKNTLQKLMGTQYQRYPLHMDFVSRHPETGHIHKFVCWSVAPRFSSGTTPALSWDIDGNPVEFEWGDIQTAPHEFIIGVTVEDEPVNTEGMGKFMEKFLPLRQEAAELGKYIPNIVDDPQEWKVGLKVVKFGDGGWQRYVISKGVCHDSCDRLRR